MIYVTHDQVEAMTLADRIVILNNGRIEQQGAPLELYERPANRFVAGFPRPAEDEPHPDRGQGVGQWESTLYSQQTALIELPGDLAARTRSSNSAFVRMRSLSATTSSAGLVSGEIVVIENLGNSTLLHVRVDGVRNLLIVEERGRSRRAQGNTVHLRS